MRKHSFRKAREIPQCNCANSFCLTIYRPCHSWMHRQPALRAQKQLQTSMQKLIEYQKYLQRKRLQSLNKQTPRIRIVSIKPASSPPSLTNLEKVQLISKEQQTPKEQQARIQKFKYLMKRSAKLKLVEQHFINLHKKKTLKDQLKKQVVSKLHLVKSNHTSKEKKVFLKKKTISSFSRKSTRRPLSNQLKKQHKLNRSYSAWQFD